MKPSTIFKIVFAIKVLAFDTMLIGASVHYIETGLLAWLYCALVLLFFVVVATLIYFFHEQFVCWVCITFYDDDDLDDIKYDVDGGSIIDWKPNEC
jgi:uncharacterized membrane protein